MNDIFENRNKETIGLTDLENSGHFIPAKQWFSLKDSCSLKGLNYKTACNRKILQPNKGQPDGTVGGRKVFKRETVLRWLPLTDSEIIDSQKSQGISP